MIIVEGPDGAGKSTLIEGLMNNNPGLVQAPRFADSQRGPTYDPEHVVDKVLKRSEWSPKGVPDNHVILDRHPLFSEPIYGPITRGTMNRSMLTEKGRVAQELIARHDLVIFCLPAFREVYNNVRGETAQMDGVVDNIHAIYVQYQIRYHTYTGHGVRYDYQNPTSFMLVNQYVSRYMKVGSPK